MSHASDSDQAGSSLPQISTSGRYTILVFAFLGWMFAGVHMSINSIVMRVATDDLLADEFAQQGIGTERVEAAADGALLAEFDADTSGELDEDERGRAREAVLSQWFGWQICAFLFGAAAGGYVFGFVGDRIGRARAMAASIFCYSMFAAASYFAETPTQLLALRFLTCMGIGGMWPNGIALLSEAWPNVARPIIAGAIGTAANVGIMLFASLTILSPVTQDAWRWTFVIGALPIFLALLSWALVPESPRWLATRRTGSDGEARTRKKVGLGEVFRPPMLKRTCTGILLGAIPLFGGWGVSNWAAAWASEAGDKAKQTQAPSGQEEQPTDEPPPKRDPALKSKMVFWRSLPGSISSLLGGAVAFWLGRKRTYFVLSLCALICTQFLFRVESPVENEAVFLFWSAALGFVSGFFFGWLPLCLPELFPTRVRSTGAGVSFNWGRILAAIGILATAAVLREALKGQYEIAGRYTGLIYGLGMLVILLMPDKSSEELEEETIE